jgi:hypothetical protein
MSEGPISHEKLEKLKQDISESEYPVKTYHRPAQFSEIVFDDLKEHLEEKYPKVKNSLVIIRKELTLQYSQHHLIFKQFSHFKQQKLLQVLINFRCCCVGLYFILLGPHTDTS